MQSLQQLMDVYRQAMKEGAIPAAYAGLQRYLQGFRLRLAKKYPDYQVMSNFYQGHMDMTFFSFAPQPLKHQQLKVLVLFDHSSCGFEIWLAGRNKDVQREFLGLIERSGWRRYPKAESSAGVDYIIKHVLDPNPDFSDLNALDKTLEKGIGQFVTEVEKFLSKHAI